jgi:hypothetical protein
MQELRITSSRVTNTPSTAATLINIDISIYANKNISANGNQRTAFSLISLIQYLSPGENPSDRYHENIDSVSADTVLLPYWRILLSASFFLPSTQLN